MADWPRPPAAPPTAWLQAPAVLSCLKASIIWESCQNVILIQEAEDRACDSAFLTNSQVRLLVHTLHLE